MGADNSSPVDGRDIIAVQVATLPFDSSTPANAEWLDGLRGPEPERSETLSRLREYLLRAVLMYLTRQRGDLAQFDYDELQQLAEDWAQQALVQVMANLDSFRGDSKFTTWAYRIAVNLVAGDLRLKRWQNVSLDRLADQDHSGDGWGEDKSAVRPEESVARSQIWTTIEEAIQRELTQRQRQAFQRVVFDEVPAEVVAAEMGTNRNNLYKIIHDARRKLRRALEKSGWSTDDVLSAFAPPESGSAHLS